MINRRTPKHEFNTPHLMHTVWCRKRVLTRGEKVWVMLWFVQRMVWMRGEDRGGHEGVSVFKQRHPGCERVGKRRRKHIPQRLRLVEQNVFNEEGRWPLGGYLRARRRVVQVHLERARPERSSCRLFGQNQNLQAAYLRLQTVGEKKRRTINLSVYPKPGALLFIGRWVTSGKLWCRMCARPMRGLRGGELN